MARYELELEPWTADELRTGGFGPTFGKALLTTRVLCGIISAQMRASIRPAWTATASDVRISRDFWDWYGGKVSLPEPAGGLLAVSFDPLLWGQDDASTPLRLSFLTRGLSGGTIDRLYPVYLRMITWANESLSKLGAGSADSQRAIRRLVGGALPAPCGTRRRGSARGHDQIRSRPTQAATRSDRTASLRASVITRKPHNWIIRLKSPVRLCTLWRFARFLTFLHGYIV